jgi:hypothetical protein
MNARNISVVLIAALIVGLASSTTATIIPRIEFEPISPVTEDIEDIDLFALIMEGDSGQVIFEFHNGSQMQSSISSIYFEDYGLDKVDDIQSAEGIFFKKDKKPSNLPGGGALDPDFDTAFSIAATSPPAFHGIEPGEQLIVTVNLDHGTTYSDIISGLIDGSVRVGMHVIALPEGSNFSAVSEAPEPATMALLGFGSMILIKKSKSRKNRN